MFHVRPLAATHDMTAVLSGDDEGQRDQPMLLLPVAL